MTRWQLEDGKMSQSEKGEWVMYTDVKQKRKTKTADPPNPAIPVLQRYYVQKFTAKVGTMPNMPYAQSGANLKALLKLHTADQVQAVMDLFFDYEKRTCFSWTRFMNAFDNLVGRVVNGGNGRKVDPDWVRQREEMHEMAYAMHGSKSTGDTE